MTALWLRDKAAQWMGPAAHRLGSFWRTINIDVRPVVTMPFYLLGHQFPPEHAFMVRRFTEDGALDGTVLVVTRRSRT